MENIAGGATVLESRERTASGATQREASIRSYQLYLAPAGDSPLRGPLGWLARLYGLDVYGTSLLSRRVAIEMGFAALMLTVIFSFDLGAWTLLFNAIFHSTGDILEPTWVSLLALAAGLLLAGAIFIYERQFVSADTSVNPVGFVLALLIRVAIVVAAAFITAQPVELLIFRGPIVRRIHQEGIAAELVARETEIRQQGERVKAREANLRDIGQFLTAETTAENQASGSLGAAVQQRDAVDRQIRKAINDAAAASVSAASAESRLQDALDRKRSSGSERDRLRNLGEDASRAEKEYRTAESDEKAARTAKNIANASHEAQEKLAQDLTSQRGSAEGRVAVEQTNLDNARRNTGLAKATIETKLNLDKTQAEKAGQDLKDYIDLVRKDGLAKEIWWPKDVKKRDARFHYVVPKYDFFEQLRVLNDLRGGRWAKWPVDETTQKELAKQYGLEWYDAKDGRLAAEAEFYTHSYQVTFVIAFLIPLLMLAVKLLMPRELSAYFSSEHQARNGNPDALLLNRTRDELRARSWLWGIWRRMTRRRTAPTVAALPPAVGTL